jgi:hypothetical protein
MIAIAAVAGIAAGLSAWVVASSALLCLFTRQWPMFVFPFDQWLLAVGWYRTVGWAMRLAIVGSAILPTIVLVLAALTVCNLLWSQQKRPALYGHTGWAGPAEMHRGGIRRSKGL